MPIPLTRGSAGSAGTLLSTNMLLAIIVTTTCQLRTGVAHDILASNKVICNMGASGHKLTGVIIIAIMAVMAGSCQLITPH